MRTSACVLQTLLEADLHAAGWDGYLVSYPGQSPKQAALASLATSLVKKYIPGKTGTTPETDAAALEIFLESNAICKDYDLGSQTVTEVEAIVIGEVKLFLYNFFYPLPKEAGTDGEITAVPSYLDRDFILSLPEIEETVGVGPGASVGSASTDFYTKLANSPLTATSPALFSFYEQTIRSNPLWVACNTLRNHVWGTRVVSGSKLSFVPKTAKVSRTICTEPILNMFYQKGVQGALERRLREVVGIDFTNQPDENSELARIGSLNGRFGTIDLKSASDSLSMSLMREILPSRAFSVLNSFRSPRTTLPSGETIDLHMISSMGNAYTFPLQTILFTAIVYAVYSVYGIHPVHFRGRQHGESNFAVFGDDIIVLKGCYDLTVRMLEVFGFRVNIDKSFNQGPFRESCGSDFSSGLNVRGVYIKHLRDANDYYSAINRLNRWSARHGVLLLNLVGYLQSMVRFLPIPADEDDSAGIKVPLFCLTKRKINLDTGGIMYRYSSLRSRRISLPPRKQADKRFLRWFENADGLLLALLAGSIRNGSISLRSTERCANIRKRWSSRWDFIPFARGESRDYSENWKVFTALNLGKI